MYMKKDDPFENTFDEDEDDTPTDGNYLPTLHADLQYDLEPFTPISEEAGDAETTRSDLQMLNNHLALCNGAIPSIKTLDALCQLSNTVCKLIEHRRKVKKLEFGQQKITKGSGFVVLD